jgi:hypothetical protein
MAQKKVIALNTIQLTTKPGKHKTADSPAVKPELMTIKPGTNFMVDDEPEEGKSRSKYQELKDAKAIRDWSREDEEALRRMSHVVGEYSSDELGDNALKLSGASATNDGTDALTGVKSEGPDATKTTATETASGTVTDVATTKAGETTTAAVESTNKTAAKKDAVNSAV